MQWDAKHEIQNKDMKNNKSKNIAQVLNVNNLPLQNIGFMQET